MRIKVLMPFLHGRERFEKDDQFTIDDEQGAHFVKNGWAEDMNGDVAAKSGNASDVTLDIQNGKHVVGDNHG